MPPNIILIIDDNSANLAVLAKMLGDKGYTVRLAINGTVALKTVQKSPPDLILLDIMMPELDGYEVCRHLKANEQTRHIPIIFMSALTETLDKVKAFNVGGVDYITKPFQTEEVLARVQTHLSLHQARQQLHTKNLQLQQEIVERQRTESALQESEQRYQQLIEVSPNAIVVFNPADKIIFVNPAGLKLFHASTLQDVLDKPTLSFVHPDNHALVLEHRHKGLAGQITGASLEYRIVCCDGAIIEVAVASIVFTYQGQQAIQVILRDITAQKQAEIALREREELFRGMFENHSAVMILTNPETGQIIEANEAAERYYGYTIAELKAMPIYAINQLAPVEVDQAMTRAKLKQHNQFEFPHRLASGEIRHVEVHSAPIIFKEKTLLFTIVHDITKRKQAEIALQESESKFRSIFEQANEGISLMDTQGNITDWSQAMARIIGISSEEAVGRPLWDIQFNIALPQFTTQPGAYERLKQMIVGMMQAGGESPWLNKMVEHDIQRPDGTRRSVQTVQFRIQTQHGYAFGSIMRDITERKQTEQAFRRYERMVSVTTNHMSLIDRNYVYQLVNQAYLLTTGKSETDLVGHTISDLYGQETFETTVKENFDNCLAGQLVHYQIWLEYRNLGQRFMDVTYSPYKETDGTISGVVVSARDITELKEIERRLAYIIDFLPDATFVIDQLGQVIAWNRAIEMMTGIKAVDILGKGDYEYALGFYPERRPILIDMLFLPESEVEKKYTHIQRQGNTIMAEAYIPNLRGREVYFVGHAAKLLDFKGETVGAIETIIDVTVRKQATNELQQANEELEYRVEDLAMLNQIAQTVTTLLDLPTMLQIIARMMTQLLNAQGTTISLLNPTRTELMVLAGFSAMAEASLPQLIGQTISLATNPVAVQIITTKQSVVVGVNETLPLVKQLMQAEGSQQLLHIPLQTRGEVIGIISVSSNQAERKFSSAEIKLAETVAGQVAGAIENARLFKDEQQQRHIAESLRDVTSILNRSLDQKTVLAEILAQLRRVIKYDGAAICLQQQHNLVIYDAVGTGKSYINRTIPLSNPDPVVQVFWQKQSYIIYDTQTDFRWPVWNTESAEILIRSWIGVPLATGNETIGVLTVDSLEVGAYRSEDIQTIQTFADQAAIAIQNAQLFEAIQHERQIADSLREVATILNRSLDQKTILTEILEQLAWVVKYDSVSVFLQDGDELVLTDGIGIAETHLRNRVLINGANPTVARCFKDKQPLIIADVNAELQWQVWSFGRLIHGWMGAPFLLGQQAIGVLCVESFQVGVYNEESAQILQIFANQAAIAIQNARLFAETERANQRFKDELTMAQEIQQSLLPLAYPNWPDLEVICYNIAANEVGGDFYQYHAFADFGGGILDFGLAEHAKIQNLKSKIQNPRYAFVIGDVSGKGVSAALLMAASLAQLDASFSQNFTPTERLVYLDKVISPYTKPRRQNCAMCYVELELGITNYELGIKNQELRIKNQELTPNSLIPNSVLRIVNAGCIPPYLKRANGVVEFHEIGGFALGQGLGAVLGYQQLTLELSKGDMVILVSDGVIEAKNPMGDMLGFVQFEQMVVAGPVSSAAEMMAHLQFEVVNFMGNAEPHDDLTLMVVQV